MPRRRDHVFVSYSHEDREWLSRLTLILRPLTRSGELRVWADTAIEPGGSWREELERALDAAGVAVLLVSPHFLGSDFIAHNELPPLLEAARTRGLKIIWIAISASMYEATPIARYQAANDPKRPLDRMAIGEANTELVRIAEIIHRTCLTARESEQWIDAPDGTKLASSEAKLPPDTRNAPQNETAASDAPPDHGHTEDTRETAKRETTSARGDARHPPAAPGQTGVHEQAARFGAGEGISSAEGAGRVSLPSEQRREPESSMSSTEAHAHQRVPSPAAEEPRTSKWKRHKTVLAGLILLTIVLVAGASWAIIWRKREVRPEPTAAPPTPVITDKATEPTVEIKPSPKPPASTSTSPSPAASRPSAADVEEAVKLVKTAHTYLADGAPQTAIQLLDQALALNPELYVAHEERCVALMQVKRYGLAESACKMAIDKAPTARAYVFLGDALRAQGGEYNQRPAIDAYTQAIKLNPKYSDAYYCRGLSHYTAKDLDDAVMDFREALKHRPQYARASFWLARVLYDQERFNQAISESRKARASKELGSQAYALSGAAYMRLGNLEQAEADFVQSLTLDPDNDAARKNLGVVREALAKKAKAPRGVR